MNLPKLDSGIRRAHYMHGSIEDAVFLARLSLKVVQEGGTVFVEVGSHLGGSALIIGNMVRGHGKLYCVDNWVQSGSNQMFIANMMEVSLYGDPIILKEMDSEKAAKEFADNSIDFCFIDADHTYRSMSNDLDCWVPKIKHGGIICGHDCQIKYSELNDQQKKAIDEQVVRSLTNVQAMRFPINDLPYSKEFYHWWDAPHVHPGVIKAVWEKFGEDHTCFGKNSSIWAHQKL